MGAEAMCTVIVGRKRASGKALLETDEIVFRPDASANGAIARFKIPFAAIKSLSASDGVLRIEHANGTAALELGPQAETWADKIRNPKSVIDKLGIKAGQRIVVL